MSTREREHVFSGSVFCARFFISTDGLTETVEAWIELVADVQLRFNFQTSGAAMEWFDDVRLDPGYDNVAKTWTFATTRPVPSGTESYSFGLGSETGCVELRVDGSLPPATP